MAHEKLRKQWKADQKKYGEKAYKLWQFRHKHPDSSWYPCNPWGPDWSSLTDYRRKEPAFQPEYFSGLNWRDAKKLVGEKVEFSDDPDNYGWRAGRLKNIQEEFIFKFRFQRTYDYYNYIRTCPETYQNTHPTVNIGGVKLSRPEMEPLEEGAVYWALDTTEENMLYCTTWRSQKLDKGYLKNKCIHLTKARAQEWASWWENTVMAAITESKQ